MARLILDTGVLVRAVLGRFDLAQLAETDDVAVPALVIAEYLAGVLLDHSPGRAAAQRAFLQDVLAVTPVLDYDRAVAEHHSVLLAHTRRTGTQRGAHHLVVAATARASNRTIVTPDADARFDELPDVAARVI